MDPLSVPNRLAQMTPLLRLLDVLIVDDDAMLRDVITMMVEAMGCRVATATNGLAALDLIAGQSFDMLITDWQMPGIDGIELVRRLRAMQGDGYLHIIMMTTRAAERTMRTGLDVAVDDFLFKPVDPIHLELSIASARRSIELQRRLARRNRHLAAAMGRARAAYRQIRSDLDIAAATQRTLLPAVQPCGALRHDWLFIPSFGVGGDSLDVRVLPDGRRFFFQIDVSGHGIPAALRSFSLHHRLAARPPVDVATMQAMIAALNRDAQDDAEGAYYTLLCGLVSADGSRVDFIRAGHPMPVIIDAAGVRRLPEGNPPIGLLPGIHYQASNVALEPGDRMLVHSDGLTECANRDGADYGDARVAAFFAARRAEPIGDCMAALEADLRRFRGVRSFDDDVSVLVLERGDRGG